MNKSVMTATLLSSLLVACASAHVDKTPSATQHSGLKPAHVLLYRTSSLQATLANAYIGIDKDYFIALDENQYTKFEIDPGLYNFRAKAHGSLSSETDIKLTEEELVCLEVRPNYEEMEWLAVPFLNAFIPSFVVKETACPSQQELNKLALINQD